MTLAASCQASLGERGFVARGARGAWVRGPGARGAPGVGGRQPTCNVDVRLGRGLVADC